MRKVCRLGLVIGMALGSSAINAGEIRIRCTIDRSDVTTTNPELDRRLNSQERSATRYYVIDDLNREAWSVVDGQKRPFCNSNETCTFQYSRSTITRQARSAMTVSDLTLDRIAGSITENVAMLDAGGRTVMYMTFGGDCRSDAGQKPKFWLRSSGEFRGHGVPGTPANPGTQYLLPLQPRSLPQRVVHPPLPAGSAFPEFLDHVGIEAESHLPLRAPSQGRPALHDAIRLQIPHVHFLLVAPDLIRVHLSFLGFDRGLVRNRCRITSDMTNMLGLAQRPLARVA